LGIILSTISKLTYCLHFNINYKSTTIGYVPDLRKEYPESIGYFASSILLMRQLYNEYTNIEFIEQLVQYLRSQELSSLFEDYEIDELENSKAKLDFVNLSLIL